MKIKKSVLKESEDKTGEEKAQIIFPSKRENGSYGWRNEMVYMSDVEKRLSEIQKDL